MTETKNRYDAFENKIITLKDVKKLQNIMKIIISQINLDDGFNEDEEAKTVFSSFLNCIWAYNPDFEYKDELDFLYKRPKTFYMQDLLDNFDTYILNQAKKLLK